MSRVRGLLGRLDPRDTLSKPARWLYALLVVYLTLGPPTSSPEGLLGQFVGALVLGYVIVYVLDNLVEWTLASVRWGYGRLTD